MSNVHKVLSDLKEQYLALHTTKEDLFWRAKMGLAEDAAKEQQALATAEIELNRFLQNPERLERLRALEQEDKTEEEARTLQGWIAMFAAHVIEDPKARALSEEIVALEKELEHKRGTMTLGYTDPNTGEFCKASSVRLSLMMRTDPEEARRKAAYEGLRSIETFVLDADFLEIVKRRNQLGRMLGYEDYYDWRVSVIERMRKKEIFDRLDVLAERTKEKAQASLAKFCEDKGASASAPWNFLYLRSGELTQKLDPYFPFASALWQWGRSFAALGIHYRDATLTLDLIDREGKYENGFMHGPEPAFFDEDTWRPARINFTANAIPGQPGGGMRALRTLFHEGGHAAHFSNILSKAPCFSHEFAPTSVAYAETQSMFLDSLMGDADWQVRYARNKDGESMPMDLIEHAIREKQPFRGWDVRAMLTIPFAERALYEMPEAELTPDRVLETFRQIERDVQGLDAGIRPVLSVPHLLSGESSAYYHGYILAEMAVYQTRDFFLKRDGHLTDNPKIGEALAEHYWAPGNAASFQETIQSLTGDTLNPDALVAFCNMDAEEACQRAHKAVEKLASIPAHEGDVQLDATIRVIHGPEVICSTQDGDFAQAAEAFASWIHAAEEASH